MKKFLTNKLFFLTLFSIVTFHIYAIDETLFKPKTNDEALFLRRIAEFWQDGEMEIAKSQLENYISTNQNSSLIDSLYALLGNLYMKEKNYSKAISCFENIKAEEIKDKVAINLLASLYNMKWYKRLIDECEVYSKKVDDSLKQKINYLQAMSIYNIANETSDKNESTKLLNTSKEKFEKLLDSSFATQAKEYLSQVHKILNDYETASNYFLQLADKDLSKQDDYLFQAALLQAHFDKEKALTTFNKILESQTSSKAQEATYNKLILLYEMARFEEITAQKDFFLSKVSNEKISLTNFFVGRSYFKLKDYENASLFLQNALKSENKTTPQMKLAHIMLMQSAFHTNKIEIYNTTFDEFSKLFPKDEELFECSFAKALLSKNNEKYELAKQEFENIMQTFEKSKENEKFIYEYAHLLFTISDTTNSKAYFKQFLEKYPQSDLIKSCYSFIVDCSIKDLNKNLNTEEVVNIKKTLVSEINTLLQKDNLFNKKEKAQYSILLAKTNFDLANYDLCLNLLQNLLKEDCQELSINNTSFLEKHELAEINLLIAFCHKYLTQDLNEFIRYAQKSLELSDNTKNHFSTFINLFNSYLSLAKENEGINENHLDKAANYLFSAYELKADEINKTNLTWLANHYINKIKNYLNANYKNKVQDNPQILTYTKNATNVLKFLNATPSENFEELLSKLSYLENIQNNLLEEENILEKLTQTYKTNLEKPFTYLEETIYRLAKNYEFQNMTDKAIALYNEFLPHFKKESPFLGAAQLHQSRLIVSTISKENFNSTNKELEKIITSLKTISLQRHLENEPTHLEAALDYVDIVCYMEKSDSWDKRLFLLGRLKDSFLSEEDVISKDYKTMRGLIQDKDRLFTAYMNIVDAEKLLCLGYIEKNVEQVKKAKEILTKMNEENLIVTSYIENRIQKTMKLIEEFKIEEK